MIFFIVLLLAHLQAVLIPACITYQITSRKSKFRLVLPDGGVSLLRFGFICFSVAALSEMVDHSGTDWIYVNHLSGWNGLFYAALAAGLASMTSAVTGKKQFRILFYLMVVAGVFAYLLLGKGVTISIQSILTIVFLVQWWKQFRDPLLWVYPLCGVVLTAIFGAMLTSSGDELWHLFIGPAGSIGLIVIWIILNRAVAKKSPVASPAFIED